MNDGATPRDIAPLTARRLSPLALDSLIRVPVVLFDRVVTTPRLVASRHKTAQTLLGMRPTTIDRVGCIPNSALCALCAFLFDSNPPSLRFVLAAAAR
jgi:hypothetical protein